MVVLHNFFSYLPTSQNWAYNLIRFTPAGRVLVYAEEYLKTNFYLSHVTYLNDGLPGIKDALSRYSEKRNFYERLLYGALNGVQKLLFAYHRIAYSRELRRQQVDIVHSHFATVALGKHELIKKAGCKHVISFYGYDYEMAPKTDPSIMNAYRMLFREADAFICEGYNGGAILKQYGCPEEKIQVVRLGIEEEKLVNRAKSKECGRLSLIQIANYTEKKGHVYTLEAFARARLRCPGITLTIVGSVKRPKDKSIAEQIAETIKRHQLEDSVELVEGIDFSQLTEYLQDFDVFIHPSCYAADFDCEGGAPVVLLDAQSAGLPVISTRHCDIPDEVIDNVTGLLADEKNVTQLAGHIEAFYNMSEATYTGFSAAAINHVRTAYNIRNSGEKLGELYASLA